MARAKKSSRSSSRSRSRSSKKSPPRVSPGTLRSIVAVILLAVGAITLIALFLPGGGILNGYVDGFLRPLFGQGAWLLGVLLLVAGVLVERAPNVDYSWITVALGGLIVFIGGQGLIHLFSGKGATATDLEQGGGALGQLLSSTLSELLSPIGAFVVLITIVLVGILLLFNITLVAFVTPFANAGRTAAGLATAGAASAAVAVRSRGDGVDGQPAVAIPVARGRGKRRPLIDEPEPTLPEPMPSPAPVSQTVWTGGAKRAKGTASAVAEPVAATATAVSATAAPVATAPSSASGAVAEVPESEAEAAAIASAAAAPEKEQDTSHPDAAEVARLRLHQRDWQLPAVSLLDPATEQADAELHDHQTNVRIIEEKLRSFSIPATVVGTNTGPVVTQYEVRPDARIKLSRIEGLADDLAMALAARSIRIEAPIPGRDVVGIEIPNHASEMVGFRSVFEDAEMVDATSDLTFALGRDVSGKPYAVDLGRMPHLLIAGATGSGKSVCVNAIVTSILMRAKPTEVRFVLVDLKRVELAPYGRIPHLLTDVIMEAHEARAALAWAVGEMEERYKKLAKSTTRNIAAYNDDPDLDPEERMPYIVLMIDELADLMIQEGRKVEEPIVKLAQKARAVGIHLVLATQRPSVNVVTGLIKANVPSRIAFAMASNVDSRTVLDQPGAEDLIGRGDMLYQPADLPRPVRIQGVFVSDAEVKAVADFWREQEPEPPYDPDVLSGSGDADDAAGGEFAWLAKLSEDELTPRAAELVQLTGKASTSMMQTKLKVGFNRASRIIEELERVGIVGPQDPRNPAVPRAVYGPENWLTGTDDVDAP
jgi:S-DNA-T family DNA segregation ATPase FtsK/SpoIIIE